jgi:DegV family protein with EDD domain
MVQIMTDSCVDLSQQLLDAHNILSIPLHVVVNGKDYLDNDLSLSQLFSSVQETGELPKTAAPSVEEIKAFFSKRAPLVFIGISSQLSATIQNAMLAANQLESSNIYILDSLNLSTGIGLLALKAADMRDQGLQADTIVVNISALRDKVKTAFVIDTMEFLHKGGRCTGLQAFVGSMLKIRPIIHVKKDGTLGVLDKIRGSRKRALDALLEGFINDLPEIDLARVFITHTGCQEDVEYLQNQLKMIAPDANIFLTLAGATIGSHCGPNTIGILYIAK